MFNELFVKKKLSRPRLLDYGFVPHGEGYRYSRGIMDGAFRLTVTFDRYGNVETSLWETDTEEDYTLYKTTAQGNFVGQVRGAIEAVLEDIASRCCETAPFRQGQTMALLAHAAEVYGDEPEFLWKSTPNNGILRRKDSGKWYGAILTVPKDRLGFDSTKMIEIIDLHGEPERVRELLKQPHFYPGWHMNKKSWYTVILDGSVEDEELFRLLEESYRLAKK